MSTILLQAAFCLPVWIALAMLVSALMAAVTRTPARRKLWLRWAIVSGFALATSWFWANPAQMIHSSGPFSGKVVDALTGKPVPVALLVFDWGGSFVGASSHGAWTMTDADGGYRLEWQGFGNWRIGAWPGPDVFYVLAPGYASGRFFLDGKERDPSGDHDASAKSAARAGGQIRLQPLRPDTKLHFPMHSTLFGISPRHEMLSIARRFYDESYPKLCPQQDRPAEWAPTDQVFHQLYSLVTLIDQEFYPSSTSNDVESRFVVATVGHIPRGSRIPLLLDAQTVQRLCTRLKLPDRGDS